MTVTTERWRFIAGTQGAYLISDRGSIWSNLAGRLLRPSVGTWGYQRVTLTKPARFHAHVHSLVMATFVGPCPPGMEVCHGGDDKTNNTLANLRYDTHRANILEMISLGNHTEAAKTECRNGHPYNEANTYLYREPNDNTARQCRVCNRETARRYKARKRVGQ